ncbi:MAG: S26 family signal peptidase, partial [Chitinophagaceae bacterium]
VMKSEYNIDAEKNEYASIGVNTFQMSLTWEAKNKMIKNGIIKNIKVDKSYNQGGGSVFPYDTLHHWTRDNFGPVWIPKKGSSVQLTPENISFYERVIRTYEHNTLEQKDGKFFINGKETNTYTFKMDYYWMAGDNRQDSQDSRYWGFVPEDRVVGKASIIWFSYEGGPRWSRLFRVVK